LQPAAPVPSAPAGSAVSATSPWLAVLPAADTAACACS
jgi:hypothetical protein